MSRAETLVTGEIDAGYQKRTVSANEAKFETYGQTPDGAVVPGLQADIQSGSDTIHFEGKNIQENNQSYDLNYNHNYKVKVDASWDQTPHDYSNIAGTLYNESSPGVFTLPDQIQTTMTGSVLGSSTTNTRLASYWGAAHNANLQTQDNKGAVHLGFLAGEHTKFDFGISEDKIEGHKPMGATFGLSQPVQLPAPVDWKVYNMRAGSQYNTKDAQFGVNYLMSAFKNDIETMIWDNPLRLNPVNGTPGQGQMNLAPDNWSHTVSMDAGFNLPAKTRFTATGSMGIMHQNQTLLPYTSNPNVTVPGGLGLTSAGLTNAASLPEQSANARMLTWTQDYALSNRVVRPVTLGVHFHSYQLINRTSEITIPGQVIADSTWETDASTNTRFEYRKDLLEGSFDYQVIESLAFGVKYGTQWEGRTDREVRDTTEKILTVTTDFKPARWAILRGSYEHAHRRPQDYDSSQFIDDNRPEDSTGLRRFDVSDRLRNQGKIMWQLSPGSVSIGLHASLTHDNFQPGIGDLTGGATTFTLTSPNPPPATYSAVQQSQMYGLLEDRDASAGIDVGWDASDQLAFDAYYDYEQTKALQRSNQNDANSVPAGASPPAVQDAQTDWTFQELDKYHMAGISANIGARKDRITWKLGYDVVMSRGATNFLSVGSLANSGAVNGVRTFGSAISPPDTKYMKQDITMKTNVRMTDRATLVLGYTYEKYDVSDWQQQNIPYVAGTAVSQTNIFLGTNLQNYVAHIGSILVKYKF